MLENPVLPKIKDLELRKLRNHYVLLKDNIREAAKENRQDIFLIPANIDIMTQALPPWEEILWREARKCVAPQVLGTAFTDFVEDRLDRSTAQVQGLPTKSTLLP